MKRPNFIVIMTDDQGYGDLSCMGATDFKTPNIDRLASSGARFTNWYASGPVCSPSRASLLTGRYPGNAGVRSILSGHRKTSGLLPEVPTISSELKKLGYQTALSGKWHLGSIEECRPHSHGFNEWMGFLTGCIDYYSHIFYYGLGGCVNPLHDLWENGEEIYDNGKYITERVTDYSVDYIRKASNKDERIDDFDTQRGKSRYSLTPEMYEVFLKKLFDYWYRDIMNNDYTYIRYFDSLMFPVMGQKSPDCGMNGHCQNQMVIEADGSVYPCDFYVLDKYRIGSIVTDDLKDLIQNGQNSQFVSESLEINETCKKCKWYSLCKGGCRRDRQYGNELGLNYFCKSYQGFFEYAIDRLQQLSVYISGNNI